MLNGIKLFIFFKCRDRWMSFFCLQLFERLQEEQPEFADKIIAVNSDLTQPELNLSKEDRSILTENVDIIFHCAATIRFNEPLKSVCGISFLLS